MESLSTGRLCSVGLASSPSLVASFAACAARKAVAKSARELRGLEAPSASVKRTVNALWSGNLRCSVVIRSLCEIMLGTITTRASSPHVALTATGGPHFAWFWRWRKASAWRACAAWRSASCAAVKGASLPLLASFLGARPKPPSPAGPPAGLASGASIAFKASMALFSFSSSVTMAAAVAASAFAFLPWPSSSYALAR